MEVYKAIAAVQAELAQIGISKSSQNKQQNFMFRGIDAVYNALAPLLAKHNLCILPRCTERDYVERTTKAGGVLFYITVKSDFDFVSAIDGSKHTITTYGEAMDSGDKATNKAMSAAYKYAAFQAFCIPTEGDNDADSTTHDLAPPSTSAAASAPVDLDANIIDQMNAATTVADLVKIMNQLQGDEKKAAASHFNSRMSELKKATS